MPRKTPEELADARRARAAERAEAEKREAEKREAEEARLEWLIGAKERSEQLQSVCEGYYDELGKQTRKWPTMPVTRRTVDRVNKLLGEVRKLLEDEEDDFAAGLDDIVPAGDLPENRDVVLILREVRDALGRFEQEHTSDWRAIERGTY
jgi:hypothetical protein